MEQIFANNIRKLRKNADLTQEELARAIGMSAQSVSKWECGYGYPDITQLPAIANFFGVTIDELLCNDKSSQEEIYKNFRQKISEYDYGSRERTDIILDHWRKYPQNLKYGQFFANNASELIARRAELREEYLPMLRETCRRLLDTRYRNFALYCFTRVCDEDELDAWLEKSAYDSDDTYRALVINRHTTKGESKKQFIQQGIKCFEDLGRLLDLRVPDRLGPDVKIDHQRQVVRLIESLGSGGRVPDGWVAIYAYKRLVLSACLFGAGRTDEAWREFEGGIESYRYAYSLKDEYLGAGGAIFANIKVDKKWEHALTEDGDTEKLYGSLPYSFFDKDHLYAFLTDPRWKWFDSARSDDRFVSAVEWARRVAEE